MIISNSKKGLYIFAYLHLGTTLCKVEKKYKKAG